MARPGVFFLYLAAPRRCCPLVQADEGDTYGVKKLRNKSSWQVGCAAPTAALVSWPGHGAGAGCWCPAPSWRNIQHTKLADPEDELQW